MRSILIGDAIAMARVLLTRPEEDWPTACSQILHQASVAERYRTRFARPHPRWGDGTIMAAASAHARAREPFLSDLRYARALSCVIASINSFLLSRTIPPSIEEQRSFDEGYVMAETRKKVAMVDPVWERIAEEAVDAIRVEPLLGGLIHSSLLHHATMERALAYRFSLKLASGEMSEQILREIADEAYVVEPDLGQSARADLVAVYDRDPACHRFLQPILFFKGYQAVQAYRIGHWLWQTGRTDLAYFVQMRVSEVFGVDIHPAAKVGRGIMIDHAHSIVIGETAVVGDNVSMLHSVTLGGTGKEDGDRHPKIEDGVMIGAGAKVLGNIRVGRCSRIAAGSVVLQDVPCCTTVAGVPARVVGEAGCSQPSVTMDQLIHA
jgi:serine O-acetyltransferase